MYSRKVIQKFEETLNNPSAHNVGRMDANAKNVGTGMVGAPACGDVMRLQIEVDDQNIITDCKFKTYGCGSAIASSQQMIEMLIGKSLEEAKNIKETYNLENLDEDLGNDLEETTNIQYSQLIWFTIINILIFCVPFDYN